MDIAYCTLKGVDSGRVWTKLYFEGKRAGVVPIRTEKIDLVLVNRQKGKLCKVVSTNLPVKRGFQLYSVTCDDAPMPIYDRSRWFGAEKKS